MIEVGYGAGGFGKESQYYGQNILFLFLLYLINYMIKGLE